MKSMQLTGSNAAARLMAPYKRAAKTPVRSIVLLVVGVAILVLDLIVSSRLLGTITGEIFKVGMLVICGISLLHDIGAAKRSFTGSAPDVWARLATIVSTVFLSLAAVAVGARLHQDWMTDILLLAASLLRLHSPRRKYHTPILFSIGAAVIAFLLVRAIPGGADAIQFAGNLAERIAPLVTQAIKTLSNLIQEGWSMQ